MKINLLPGESRSFDPRPVAIVLGVLLLVAVAPLWYALHSAQQSVRELQGVEQELTERLTNTRDISSLVSERDSLQRQWNMVLADVYVRRLFVTDLTAKVTSVLPQRVHLTELNMNHDSVSMRATAPDYRTIVEFMGHLIDSPYFSNNPRLSGLGGSPGNYSFSVTVGVLGGTDR